MRFSMFRISGNDFRKNGGGILKSSEQHQHVAIRQLPIQGFGAKLGRALQGRQGFFVSTFGLQQGP